MFVIRTLRPRGMSGIRPTSQAGKVFFADVGRPDRLAHGRQGRG